MFELLRRLLEDKELRRSALWWFSLTLCVFILSSVVIVYFQRASPLYLLSKDDIQNVPTLISVLKTRKDPLAQFLWESLSDDLRRRLSAEESFPGDYREMRHSLAKELNNILRGNCIFTTARFSSVSLSDATKLMLMSDEDNEAVTLKLNRHLLEEAYPDYISKHSREWTKSSISIWSQASFLFCGIFVGAFAWELWKRVKEDTRMARTPANGDGKRNRWRKFCDQAARIFFDPQIKHDCASAFLFAGMITIASLAPTIFFIDNPSFSQWVSKILDNPGGIFALTTGIATVVGTFIAVHSILEVRHTITSFPQLMDRLAFMINEKG